MGLSDRSRYLRFHGYAALTPDLVTSVLDPDWAERGAFVGVLGKPDAERIVALASYVRLRDPLVAEAAFAVADELQGHGVGTRLLEQLAAAAAPTGIEAFVAEVLPDILVKGGDYQPDEIHGRAEVEAAGGRVLSLPFIEGASTSSVIERIRKEVMSDE